MKSRLLILTEGYPWQGDFAGAFHRDQFQLLAKLDFEITVVVPTPWVPPFLAARKPQWRRFSQMPLEQIDGGVTILRPRYFAMPRENIYFWPDIFRYAAVRRLKLRKPDVVQAYFAIPTGAAARKLARAWNVPYVVGLLGDDVNIYPLHSARNRRLIVDVVREASFTFANGPTLAANARRLTGFDIPAIPMGSVEAVFAPKYERAEAKRMLNWPVDRKVALYVGALSETKGMPTLLSILDRLPPDVLIALVGDGAFRSAFEGRDNVLLLGPQPSATVALAMNAADILVHPSHYEGLPTVLVEAGFAQLPIVTTDAPGCIDLAKDGRALHVPVNDSAQTLAAITAALSDAASSAQRVELMLAHLREHYSLERNANRLAEIYRAAIAKQPLSSHA